MKKTKTWIALLAFLAFILSALLPIAVFAEGEIEGLSVAPAKTTLIAGGTTTATLTGDLKVGDDAVSSPTYRWEVVDANPANCISVSGTEAMATISGSAAGTAKVKVTVSGTIPNQDGSGGATKTVTGTAVSNAITVKGDMTLSVNPTTLTLNVGGTGTAKATVGGASTSDYDIKWTSGATSTATVSDDTAATVTITGVDAGNATITCTATGKNDYDGVTKTATVAVQVQAAGTPTLNISGTTSVAAGSTTTLTAKGTSDGSTDLTTEQLANISWSVSGGAATVSPDKGATCTVTGVSEGKATVTASYTNSENKTGTATTTITVTSSGGDTPEPSTGATYTVTPPTGLAGGIVSVNPSKAEAGDTVTITLRADTGNKISSSPSLSVTGDVPLTKVTDATYTFVMPANNVTVTATNCFESESSGSEQPSASPSASASSSATTTPSGNPSAAPSTSPSVSPSASATRTPSPSSGSTYVPTEPVTPSGSATASPSASPSTSPSASPSSSASASPSASSSPSSEPTELPTTEPTEQPTASPTAPPPAAGVLEPNPDAPSAEPVPGETAIPGESTSVEIVNNPDLPENASTAEESLVVGIPITPGSADSAAEAGTSVADIGDYLVVAQGAGSISVETAEGEPAAPETPLSTGQIIVVTAPDGSVVAEATVVIQGDVLGTGRMNISQIVRAARSLNGVEPLTGIYLQAGKFDNASGNLNISDLVRMARMLTAMEPTV